MQPIAVSSYRRLVACITTIVLAVVLISVGVVYKQDPPFKSDFMAEVEYLRKPRDLTATPVLSKLYRNHSTFQLLQNAQSKDTLNCSKNGLKCVEIIHCNKTIDQVPYCQCPHGYYVSDRKCHACTSCESTQYLAIPCSSTQDSICIDISFPIGMLPWNNSQLQDDGRSVSIAHSKNVFVERLINMDALETPMYVTNNQQSLDFVWPRTSGLDIGVSVSGVYMVPDYDDVGAVDDTALFHRLLDPSQKMKYLYNYVQTHYCRHPVPDYYSIQLEVIPNRTSTAEVIRCDSQDDMVPRCPAQYKDGDRYLKWNINVPCPSYMTTKLNTLKDGPNSVVCTEETDLLRELFQRARPTTQEYMFSSRECDHRRKQCEQCLKASTCPVSSANMNDSYMGEDHCCELKCYIQPACLKSTSKVCSLPTVECATGEVNIFSLFPHFDSMDRQFSCQIRYVPPHQLYSVRYIIKIPHINFNTTSQEFTVFTNSRSDHEKRLSQFDFITAFHDTRIKIEDELILIGDHRELKTHQESLMKPYRIRELKTASELRKEKPADKSRSSNATYVQFEKPFLYSSFSWYKDGCYKNMSQIYPNQTIYKDDFTPVIARKTHFDTSPDTTLLKPQGFTYRLYHRDRAPYIKFFVEKGKSVLQHLQRTSAQGRLIASSLLGSVKWTNDKTNWNITFSAKQDVCPTVISIKIFTQFFSACVGHFDMLITCPLNFVVSFSFPSEPYQHLDQFILQINDSATSHNLVLSSLFHPIYEYNTKLIKGGQLETKFTSSTSRNGLLRVWVFVILVLIFTTIVLVINCAGFRYITMRSKESTEASPVKATIQTFQKTKENNCSKYVKTFESSEHSKKFIVVLFVILYILYSIIYTFSLAFSIVYLTHCSYWSNTTNIEVHKQLFLKDFNKSLSEIKEFEMLETNKLLALFKQRSDTCLSHLKHELKKQMINYEETTRHQIESVFSETGKAFYFTEEIQKNNFSIYLGHIREFLKECNRTVTSLVERFQANFFHFVHNTAHNDWLKVPRQIFLYQDGENPDMRFLSSLQVRQFASWLEIDKAEESFAAKENVYGRLSSLQPPEVSPLDTKFPFLHQWIESGLSEIELPSSSDFYTVLDPLFPEIENNSHISSELNKITLNTMLKTEVDTSELISDQEQLPNKETLPYSQEKQDTLDGKIKKRDLNFEDNLNFVKDNSNFIMEDNSSYKRGDNYDFKKGVNSDLNKGANYHTNAKVTNVDNDLPVLDFNFLSDQRSSSEITLPPEKSIPSNESNENNDNIKLYILMAMFIIFDIFLWAHRISWLRNELQAIRHGYPCRTADDETCKQLLKIEAAQHFYPFGDASKYLYHVNDVAQRTMAETGIIFLKDLRTKNSKSESLQDIWREKIQTGNKTHAMYKKKECWGRTYILTKRKMQYFFISYLTWQGSVTFIAVILVCITIYYTGLWFTPENLQTVTGGRSAAQDIQCHVATTDRHLQLLANWLMTRLEQMKQLSDIEVRLLTDMYFDTLNLQTTMFNTILQRLCEEAKGSNCDKLMSNYSKVETIVGCNFLPLQAQTFPGLNVTEMEALLTTETTVKMDLTRRTLLVSASVIILFLCTRLLCQASASSLRHFFLLTGRLSRLQIHLTEKVHLNVSEAHGTTLQRSQSWVDSCESGVYLGETEDTGKEDNR